MRSFGAKFCRPNALALAYMYANQQETVIGLSSPFLPQLWILSLSALTAILPGEPGLEGFIGAGDNGGDGETWAIRRAKLQSDRHHQQTNTHFITAQMPFLSLNQQCQSTLNNNNNTNQINVAPYSRKFRDGRSISAFASVPQTIVCLQPVYCRVHFDSEWMKKCMDYEVEGINLRGWPKRTLKESVETDVKNLKIKKWRCFSLQ